MVAPMSFSLRHKLYHNVEETMGAGDQNQRSGYRSAIQPTGASTRQRNRLDLVRTEKTRRAGLFGSFAARNYILLTMPYRAASSDASQLSTGCTAVRLECSVRAPSVASRDANSGLSCDALDVCSAKEPILKVSL